MLTEMLTILLTEIKSFHQRQGLIQTPLWHMRGPMRSFRLGTNPRVSRIALGLTAAAAAVLLAACSSSGSPGSSSTTPQGTATSSSSTATSSGANVAALSSAVTQGAAVPSFATYQANYGGKIPSIANLADKKIMIIPGVSALAACEEIAQADAAIATAVGMKPTIFANQGTTAEHNTAIEDAIHQGYAAIDMGCAVDPSTSAPAIAQAEAAGIAVAVYGATPQEATAAGVTYNNVDPYALDAKIAADQAVSQHGGKPFHSIAITSNAAPATEIMQSALKAELKKNCPACTMTEVNIEVPNWQTDIQSAVTSALLQNPNVTVRFPDYAGMLTYMLAGIQGGHRTNNIKTYLAFGV